MKENYLWDKTGEKDAEIEKLENALQAFRYKETALPAMPASNVIPFSRKSARRKVSRFVLSSAAACLMFGLLVTGIWLQFIKDKTETQHIAAESSDTQVPAFTPPIDTQTDDAQTDPPPSMPPPPVRKPKNSPVKEVEKPKQPNERKNIKIPQPFPAKIRRSDIMANNVKPAKSEKIELTEEEQYAYDQLMLALSITSSKLKIVKDKVDGTDE